MAFSFKFGFALTALRRRGGASAVLSAIARIFPGYLSGAQLVCATPNDAAWHLAVGAHQGALLDCSWPTPGSPGSGIYSTLDCSTEIPA